ncbi:ABC-type branched-chain amino acid transport system, periplasmic component [uncultured Desulfatiglans sp.]|nr:ABC-type branched-chain amino acid transport system, periplasmic component [uncultured Desulfatiglans sp.]
MKGGDGFLGAAEAGSSDIGHCFIFLKEKGEEIMKKGFFLKLLAVALCVGWVFGFSGFASADQIKLGGIMDTTGGTSDVGKDYAIGMDEAFKYFNEQGGVNGKEIKYTWFDYGYRIPEAITKYKLLKRLGVLAIMGWGTGDTEALSPTVNKDEIPYISASYSAHLTDPAKSRYNIFFSSDYSTNARAALTAWFDKRWPQKADYGKRKPRFACAYMFASPYCSAPIKAIKDQAALLGFDIGDDQDVSLFALDTKSQIMALKTFAPDVVWHGNTTMSVSATIRDAYSLGLGADWIVNNFGFDENLPRLAGEAAEGVMGATPCAFYGQESKNMDIVVAAAKKYNPSVPQNKRLNRTIQAWCDAIITVEAMKRADSAGQLTGPGMMVKGFETMDKFEIGLAAAPVTYTATDHRPTTGCLIQEYKGGKFQVVERVDLKERWPDKWEKEWLGW